MNAPLLSHSADDVEIFTVSLLVLDLFEKEKNYYELREKLIPFVEALSEEVEKREDCQLILELTAGERDTHSQVREFIYRRLHDLDKMDYFKVTLLAYLLYQSKITRKQ